jgi:ribosomal protein S18 acetylase RimI-like enzyme
MTDCDRFGCQTLAREWHARVSENTVKIEQYSVVVSDPADHACLSGRTRTARCGLAIAEEPVGGEGRVNDLVYVAAAYPLGLSARRPSPRAAPRSCCSAMFRSSHFDSANPTTTTIIATAARPAMGYVRHLTDQDFIVRAARAQEASAILELWQQARSEHATTPDRLQDVQRLLLETPGSLLVAEGNNAILGVLIAAWDGWRGNMYRLAVRFEHRRRGIGRALVRAGEEHMRCQGARRITALVGYEDEVAAAFWESAGYPRDHEIGRRVRNL